MRHIKHYKNWAETNEEGWLKNIILASTLLFSNTPKIVSSNPKVGVEKQTTSKIAISFAFGSTSKEPVSNKLLQDKFGLPKGDSKYWVCTVDDIKNYKGDSVLSIFKPWRGTLKYNDYLKIGKKEISESGSQIFNMQNREDVVIGSGNGLLALSRALREAKGRPFSILEISLGSERESKYVDFNSDKATNLSSYVVSIFAQFQTSITPEYKFHQESSGKKHYGYLINASQEKQVIFITNYINQMSECFIPTEMKDEVFKNIQFKKFPKEKVDSMLTEFKKDGIVTSTKFNKFISEVRNLYLENFNLFMNYLVPNTSKMWTSTMDKNLNTNFNPLSSGLPVWNPTLSPNIKNPTETPTVKTGKKWGIGE